MDQRTRLAEIAGLIQAGANPEAFKVELDLLLGTEMEDRDHFTEAAWENDYRQVAK